MTTLDPALLAAILESPADDLPRLAAADWWQENGEWERGEFIAVQCELARRRHECEQVGCDGCTTAEQLRRREMELLDAKDKWGSPNWITWCGWHHLMSEPWQPEFRRGFPHTTRCTAADWQRWIDGGVYTVGQKIMLGHPVERVEFTDCNGIAMMIRKGAFWHFWVEGSPPPGQDMMRHAFQDRAALIDAMPCQLDNWMDEFTPNADDDTDDTEEERPEWPADWEPASYNRNLE